MVETARSWMIEFHQDRFLALHHYRTKLEEWLGEWLKREKSEGPISGEYVVLEPPNRSLG